MRYPEAQWLANGQTGGSYTGGPFRLVIHTTETAGLPDYSNGWSAPHITYHPGFRAFYQHTDFNTAARALRNEAGGVQTNRRSALQIEIIAYSAKNIADQTISRQWVGDLTDENYADLREFIAWCVDTFGVTETWPNKQAFNATQANQAGFRMTGTQWNAFGGVCGHQHVPENTHWDPGAIDWKKLLPATQPLEMEDEMTPEQEAKLDAVLAAVGLVPRNVWGTTFATGDYTRSAQQSLMRTEQATQRIEAGQDSLDEAELAALILAGLPAQAIADAIEAGPLVDAVRDELNRRFDA